MSLFPRGKVALFPRKHLVPSEKVTPSEGVEKETKLWNDMEEPVHTIHRKGLDKFQGQSTASTGWFNLDHEWLKRTFLHLNRVSIKNLFENNIEGQDIKTYKNFVLLLDNIKFTFQCTMIQ